MNLLALVLGLFCIVVCTTAERKKGQYWPTNTKIFTTSHRFRRDLQGSIVTNLKNAPPLPYDNNENLRFVLSDNKPTTVDFGKNDNEILDSQSQSNILLNNMHRIDENDYFSAYTFPPGAYGGFAYNFGTGGGFRWRRETTQHVESRFR